jgi:hypothetical protein
VGGNADYAGTDVFLTLTAVPAATVTTLNANLTNIAQGVGVTFTAEVTPSTANGTVTFSDGGATLGTGTLSAGAAIFMTSTLAVGTHSVTATYSGDANDAASISSPSAS